MTNKLPVVGSRYRPKNDNLRNHYCHEYEVIAITSKRLVVKIIESRFKYLIDMVNDYDLDWISKHLEELPIEEPQPTKESQVDKVEEVKTCKLE